MHILIIEVLQVLQYKLRSFNLCPEQFTCYSFVKYANLSIVDIIDGKFKSFRYRMSIHYPLEVDICYFKVVCYSSVNYVLVQIKFQS